NESGSCVGCPLRKINRCVNQLQESALDFINRQKAEIERLEAEINESNEADREAELHALTESKESAKLFCEAINHAKSEARKEFATFLKNLINRDLYHSGRNIVKKIDKLLKEMDGESNV
ncbi:MAG: hypothetical protein IJ300_09735, partial [Clostridia bacterium]|nr:hypothetical protein [Clostridia bacterium]